MLDGLKKMFGAGPAQKQVDSLITPGTVAPGPGRQPAAAASRSPFAELGVAGVKIAGGYVYEDFLEQLLLERGRRIWREMRDNDSTVNAIMFAIEMIMKAVDWRVVENKDNKTEELAREYKELISGMLFEDMDHTWDAFITEVIPMLVFGWEWFEIVYKRRVGPDQANNRNRSKFTDGLIGIAKLANRPPETLDRWNIDERGDVRGLWQQPPLGGTVRYIPIEKSLHFVPHGTKNNPEGRSILRGAYRSWFFLKNIQEIEAIAIEREMNGLPVVYAPDEVINGTTPEAQAARQAYIKMARDIKFNEQGGAVIPSDPYYDADGRVSNMRKVELKLLASEGNRSIDTGEVILRYQREIARTVLADFMMLGSTDRGSFALSRDKSDLFVRALKGWMDSIAETLNRHLIPKIFQMNGLDLDYMPYLDYGEIAPVDLEELGRFISDVARAGAPLFPDNSLEETLRDAAGLPGKDPRLINEDDPTIPMPVTGPGAANAGGQGIGNNNAANTDPNNPGNNPPTFQGRT